MCLGRHAEIHTYKQTQAGTDTGNSRVLMLKVTAAAPYSFETLQKTVTSELTGNWTELRKTPSISSDSVSRFWRLKTQARERTPTRPEVSDISFAGDKRELVVPYPPIRGGPTKARSGESSGTAVQADCLVDPLFQLRVAFVYYLWRTFILESKMSHPAGGPPPPKHFNSILHLHKTRKRIINHKTTKTFYQLVR